MTISVSLFSLLPKKLLSSIWGLFMDVPYPAPINRLAINIFAWITGADGSEAEYPISQYKSIGAFFVRALKPGARTIGVHLDKGISPVDGCIRGVQTIESGALLQVKGVTYSVAALVGDVELANGFEGGLAFNFYLSPKDYHRIHSPVSGKVEWVKRIPGDLWPVNDWSWQRVPGLFTINERVVVVIATALGRVAVVMVGAYNVGRISLAFDWGSKPKQGQDISLAAGEHLGTFGMGSSVVVLYQKSMAGSFAIARSEGAVLMGSDLFL
jgi:phosphatidylserine decarboxylase